MAPFELLMVPKQFHDSSDYDRCYESADTSLVGRQTMLGGEIKPLHGCSKKYKGKCPDTEVYCDTTRRYVCGHVFQALNETVTDDNCASYDVLL